MTNDVRDDQIERWWARTPENKLELIDGRLIVSTLAGSRFITRYLLRDYGPAMALPLAPAEVWWKALRQAFDPHPVPPTPEEWVAWAMTVEYDPEPPPAGPYGTLEHRRTYDLLSSGLRYFGDVGGLGRALGRDFVIRLGENGLTPDLLFADRATLANLHEYYLDGPPQLVIEITLPGSAEQDRSLKRRLYEQAGIAEYWLIEAAEQQAVFLRLGDDGRYHPAAEEPTGVYHSAAVPELALSLPHLWTMKERARDQSCLPFLPPPRREEDLPPLEHSYDPDELGWDFLPYAPRVGLEPVPIRFEEFISWCPQAKFEDMGGLWIGGSEGSRRCMGMLLMTLGLVEAVKLATPREWVAFLHKEPYRALVEKHTEALMAQAEYEPGRFRDESYVYGRIPERFDLSATGDTLEECRDSLTETVSNQVLLRLVRGEDPTKAGR
jgi:Uma2 family endonuclease